jgi:hypothetical protein
MELIEHNASNSVAQRNYLPAARCHLCIANGRISFNSSAADMIGLKPNDRVKFFQDKNTSSDWYVEKVKEEDGFIVNRDKSKYRSVRFQNKALVIKVIDCFSEKKNISFLIAGTPNNIGKRKLWGLLKTASV